MLCCMDSLKKYLNVNVNFFFCKRLRKRKQNLWVRLLLWNVDWEYKTCWGYFFWGGWMTMFHVPIFLQCRMTFTWASSLNYGKLHLLVMERSSSPSLLVGAGWFLFMMFWEVWSVHRSSLYSRSVGRKCLTWNSWFRKVVTVRKCFRLLNK